MTDSDVAPDEAWRRTCPRCGTELTSAVIDFDPGTENRAELQPGEMVAVDYCPNPDCRWNAPGGEDAGRQS